MTTISAAEFRDLWLEGHRLVQRALGSSDSGVLPSKSALPSGAELEPGRAVWWEYAKVQAEARQHRSAPHPVDLLIEPGSLSPASVERSLVAADERTDGASLIERSRFAVHGRTCAASLTFEEFLAAIVPISQFAPLLAWAANQPPRSLAALVPRPEAAQRRAAPVTEPLAAARAWFVRLLAATGGIDPATAPATKARALAALLPNEPRRITQALARVSLNRVADISLQRSRRTVKADAATLVFDVRCDEIAWAVVDSGIDARHGQFQRRDGPPPVEGRRFDPATSRVVETFDFTKLRGEQNRQRVGFTKVGRAARPSDPPAPGPDLDRTLPAGVIVTADGYVPPPHPHGTHVAGIIGGLDGICPDISLYDYRVIGADGTGREFAVVAALRHILEQNRRFRENAAGGRTRDLLIHGVNLSLSLDGDVPSDACGWSLVCRMCDELVRSGVVVVAAAGNSGFARSPEWQELSYGHTYRTVSIADPGNAERVITVGSTHPERPLEHGISYFSARGPTADGRHKPDLVAPGDAIESALGYSTDVEDVWEGTSVESGTSQAAAHVSACAAMLLARNRELIGKPEEVKAILCRSATDLGRDRNFQGHGLVDALRALQDI